MDKEYRAVVFIFDGYEPTSELIGVLANEIAKRCKVTEGTVECGVLSEADMCKASAAFITRKKPVTSIEETATPEDQAVIYIGTIMKNHLGIAYKPEKFVNKLMELMVTARNNPEDESSKKLMNALFILSQEDLVVSKAILKKYYMNEAKIATIKHVYNLLKTV